VLVPSRLSVREPSPPNGSVPAAPGNIADGGGKSEKALDMFGKAPDNAAAYCE